MKIIEIQGGLGNQLFLYVYWQWMCKQFPKERIWGLYPSRGLTAHNGLEIHRWFDVEMPPTSIFSNIVGYSCFWLNKMLRRLHLPIPYCSDNDHLIKERLFHDGFYQNVCYQEGVEMPKFKKDLNIDKNNQCVLEEIRKPNAVSVHIRRGDYLKDKHNQRIYGGICTDEYYEKAISIIERDVPDAHYFFFSDDEDFVRSHFYKERMTIVNINKGERSFFDLYLMAHATRMIIANSTFSCWAAYLNSDCKTIVCPKRFANNRPNLPIQKKEWIKI